MTRQTQGERNDGKRWRRGAAGGENRAPGDEEIRHAMHAGIRINDAVLGIGGIARRAKLMPAAFQIVRPTFDFPLLQRYYAADAEATQLGIDNLLAAYRRAAVDRQHTPVDLDAPQTKRVPDIIEGDVAVRIGCLFGFALQHESLDETVRLEEAWAAVGPTPLGLR